MFDKNFRWYDAHGNVFVGLTNDEALDQGLIPSVTNILSIIRRPALDRWLHIQVANAAARLDKNEFASETEWILAVEREADAFAFSARAAGLTIHADLTDIITPLFPHESFLIKRPSPTVSEDYQFGGEADAILVFENEAPVLIEVKTTKRQKPTYYPEHLLQLAAYSLLYSIDRAYLVSVSQGESKAWLSREINGDLLRQLTDAFITLTKFWWAYQRVRKTEIKFFE